ncbi:MAG TPA: hypothetical protein VKG45_11170 [Actinomycetes bacterium]|nr:hypothetical protein [Actinomycetes bacterium]
MDGRSDGRERTPRGSEIAWGVLGYLVAGVVAWGGIGWLLDRWVGTRLFLPLGVVVGFAGAFYLIIRRYGRL